MPSRILFLATAAFAASMASSAFATTITVSNTTDTVAYQGSSPTGYFGGSDVGSNIGTDYATSQLALTTTALAGGNYSLDLQYSTLFSGTDNVGGYNINYADIFLRAPGAGYSATGFNYAISLGQQSANGDARAAGLYSVTSDKTSQDIWSGRSGVTYGGQYTNSTASQPGSAGYQGYNSDTVLTAGNKVTGATYSSTAAAGGGYTVDVKLTLTAAQASIFGGAFDVFWGTGDCSNGSFLASFGPGSVGPTASVPEPATLALLAVGLLGLAFVRRQSGRTIG